MQEVWFLTTRVHGDTRQSILMGAAATPCRATHPAPLAPGHPESCSPALLGDQR